MKNRTILTIASIGATAALFVVLGGCASPAPPSAFEQRIFNVETNQVPRLTIDKVPLPDGTFSNYVHTVNEPSYQYHTKPEVADTVKTTGNAISGAFGFPFAGTAATTILALWGWIRSSRKGDNMGASLAQIIETAREVLRAVPNGSQYDQAFVNFMQQHQTETGVITQVASILDNAVSNNDAKAAAQDILDIVNAVKNPPPAASPVGGISPVARM